MMKHDLRINLRYWRLFLRRTNLVKYFLLHLVKHS